MQEKTDRYLTTEAIDLDHLREQIQNLQVGCCLHNGNASQV